MKYVYSLQELTGGLTVFVTERKVEKVDQTTILGKILKEHWSRHTFLLMEILYASNRGKELFQFLNSKRKIRIERTNKSLGKDQEILNNWKISLKAHQYE
jgi:hypothetical protein